MVKFTLCFCAVLLTVRCQEPPSAPQNSIVPIGGNVTLHCLPLFNPLVWRREGTGSEPIYDGTSVLLKHRAKFATPTKDGGALVLLNAALEDADVFECVKEEMTGKNHFAVIIVSDHKNIRCNTEVDGVGKEGAEVVVEKGQTLSIHCTFPLHATRHCRPTALWRHSDTGGVDAVDASGGDFTLTQIFPHDGVNATFFTLSVSFECGSHHDLQHAFASNEVRLNDIFSSPAFYFLQPRDPTTTTTPTPPIEIPTGKSVHTFNFTKSAMLTFMIVIGCLFILLFFLFITYIIVTRRKFHFHQQDSLIDYMRPASGVGASSLRYSPSNLILTDNVAFKRQATENSYNIHSPRPIPPTPPTTTSICHTLSPNSHNLPPNSLTYRFHPQLFPQAPHTPSSLQAPAFPPSSHLLPFQNSLPYQPLLHNHCNRLNSSEDFYDTIRDLQASPHDVKPPLHLSTPTTTTTTTTITSPTLSTTPFNYLLKQHHQRPESLPAVEPPPPPPHQPSPPLPSSPPPPHPDETLGVYLIPENKND